MAISSSAPCTLPDRGLVVDCALARSRTELDAHLADHFAIRRCVFVEAQRLFALDDRDERDAHPATLHAVGLAGAEVVGAVRLYPLDDDGLQLSYDLPEFGITMPFKPTIVAPL